MNIVQVMKRYQSYFRVLLLAPLAVGCGGQDDEQPSASLAADSVASAASMASVSVVFRAVDPRVGVVVTGATVSIDFSAHPVERAMNYEVSRIALEGEQSALLLGYLASDGGPGRFEPYSEETASNLTDGVVVGAGPDVFDISGLEPGNYRACVNDLVDEDMLCVEFTVP